jgi:hypothetical protein
MSQEYIDIICDSARDIREISEELRGMALAFSRVGNMTLAKELVGHADELTEKQNNITKAFSKEINNQYHKSKEFAEFIFSSIISTSIIDDDSCKEET